MYHKAEILVGTERLQLKVGGVSRNRKNTKRVGVAEASLPALHSDHSCAGLDEVELQGIAETKSNTVIDLTNIRSIT